MAHRSHHQERQRHRRFADAHRIGNALRPVGAAQRQGRHVRAARNCRRADRIRCVAQCVLHRARQTRAARQLSARIHRTAVLDFRRRRWRRLARADVRRRRARAAQRQLLDRTLPADRRQARHVGGRRAGAVAARRRSADAVGRVEKWKCAIKHRRFRARHAREFHVAGELSRAQHRRSKAEADARAGDSSIPGQSACAVPQFRGRRESHPRSRRERRHRQHRRKTGCACAHACRFVRGKQFRQRLHRRSPARTRDQNGIVRARRRRFRLRRADLFDNAGAERGA